VVLAPIALLNILTRSPRNAIEWVNRELPMIKFLWPEDDMRLRMFLVGSLLTMLAGKWVNVQVPFIMQSAIDAASIIGKEKLVGEAEVARAIPRALVPLVQSLTTSTGQTSLAGVGTILLLFYGIAKALSVVFAEVKTSLFAHVSQNVLRKFANQIFAHLHSLDSEFFTATPSGVISQAYARAVRGFQTMLFQIVFSITPTLVELVLVCSVLYTRLGGIFSAVTLATFVSYLAFTVWITRWRVQLREKLVAVDNARNGFFVDSILNQETVKLYTQESREGARFNTYLQSMADLQIQSTYAIAALNLGQAVLFTTGLTASLIIALHRVSAGLMSVGDLIAVNASMLQLSIPFNFIGYTYQELRQSYVDMQFMNTVLATSRSSVSDANKHVDMNTLRPRSGATGKWVRILVYWSSFLSLFTVMVSLSLSIYYCVLASLIPHGTRLTIILSRPRSTQ
jgi:ATP-binding cassette subfamily B protein